MSIPEPWATIRRARWLIRGAAIACIGLYWFSHRPAPDEPKPRVDRHAKMKRG